MSLSRTRLTFYALVLAAALTGLAVSHTRPSEAAPPQREGAVDSITPAPEPPEDELPVDGPRLASLFTSHDAPEQRTAAQLVLNLIGPVRDVFALSPVMERYYRVRSQGAESDETQEARQSAEQFRAAHRLNGTFLQQHDRWAIVDGVIVRVGQTLDDFQLREIEHYRVVFQRGAHTATLELPGDFDTQVRPPPAR